jgi:predicted phage terminase large subunit-like protein
MVPLRGFGGDGAWCVATEKDPQMSLSKTPTNTARAKSGANRAAKPGNIPAASTRGETTVPGGMTRPIGVKPEGSKVDRMAAQSAKIEAGHVYLPKSAAWLGEFLTELLSFPNGRHDDQVDSVSQFLRWLQDAYLNQISFHVAVRRLQAEGISSSLETLQW